MTRAETRKAESTKAKQETRSEQGEQALSQGEFASQVARWHMHEAWVDLMQCPVQDSMTDEGARTVSTPAAVVLPDLHGNVLYFLHSLFRYGILTWRETLDKQGMQRRWDEVALAYKQLSDRSKKTETGGGGCEAALAQFTDWITNQLEVCGNTELTLIGDVLADRGRHDWPTMLLLEQLINAPNLRLNYIYGNHDDYWCSQHLILRPQNPALPVTAEGNRLSLQKDNSNWARLDGSRSFEKMTRSMKKALYEQARVNLGGPIINMADMTYARYNELYHVIREAMTPLRFAKADGRLLVFCHTALNHDDVEMLMRGLTRRKDRLSLVDVRALTPTGLEQLNEEIKQAFQVTLCEVYDKKADKRSWHGCMMRWIQDCIWLRSGVQQKEECGDYRGEAYYLANRRGEDIVVHGHAGKNGGVYDRLPQCDRVCRQYLNLDQYDLGKSDLIAYLQGPVRDAVLATAQQRDCYPGDWQALKPANTQLFPPPARQRCTLAATSLLMVAGAGGVAFLAAPMWICLPSVGLAVGINMGLMTLSTLALSARCYRLAALLALPTVVMLGSALAPKWVAAKAGAFISQHLLAADVLTKVVQGRVDVGAGAVLATWLALGYYWKQKNAVPLLPPTCQSRAKRDHKSVSAPLSAGSLSPAR